ncbi:hypothetical protein Slin14017_G055170 [Septoria linicola]|nr:hypothetical protein Slin14017_G055170 [Septoria linicola]
MEFQDEANEVASRIRVFAASQLRTQYPYMKTATLEDMLDHATDVISSGICNQPVNTEMLEAQSRTNFFSLSAELRSKVYELTCEQDVVDPKEQRRFSKGLLDVCQQIRREALPMWYSSNTFTFEILTFCADQDGSHYIKKWIDSFGVDALRSLTKVKIVVESFVSAPTFLAWQFDTDDRHKPNDETIHEALLRIYGLNDGLVPAKTFSITWIEDDALTQKSVEVYTASGISGDTVP